MRVLATGAEIEHALMTLLGRCSSLKWAVAWASCEFALEKLLRQHEDKIEQLSVGIHFYQTHPQFIESFIGHPAARFVMNPDGVFHPKLYYFEHEGGEWDAVLGSANFTRGAFSFNAEVAVQISNSDVGAETARAAVRRTLDSYLVLAKQLTEADVATYRQIWARQQRRLSPLGGSYQPSVTTTKPQKSPLEVPLFVSDWPQYFESVKEDTVHKTEGRLAVLEEARRLFETHSRLDAMAELDRKCIAGFARTDDLDWLWFGSMKGAGYFKQAINKNSSLVADALDAIPLSGAIVREDFEEYVRRLRLAATSNIAVATATRLLTFKRPDYFVCLDTKNRKKLCEAFAISQGVSLDDYWDKVVERITDSNWWNAPEPTRKLDRRIWRCRAAFLDVRFYEP